MEIGQFRGKLVFLGAFLFLLGLLQGALIPYFLNPRMALSAHLAAVQSGMALIIFGLIWQYLSLNATKQAIAFYFLSWSMFLIWMSITLGAIVGASRALPLAGAGFATQPFWEMVVEVTVIVGGGLGIIGTGVLVYGLWRGLKANP